MKILWPKQSFKKTNYGQTLFSSKLTKKSTITNMIKLALYIDKTNKKKECMIYDYSQSLPYEQECKSLFNEIFLNTN